MHSQPSLELHGFLYLQHVRQLISLALLEKHILSLSLYLLLEAYKCCIDASTISNAVPEYSNDCQIHMSIVIEMVRRHRPLKADKI